MRILSGVLAVALLAPLAGVTAAGQTSGAEAESATSAIVGGAVKCTDGKIGVFECQNVELLSYLPLDAVGGSGSGIILNDIWGWSDSATGREFAVVGRSDGTAFVEVTDPVNPKYLGLLPLHEGSAVNFWRAVKVYKNHAFVVAESGPHGLQIFDLTQLRDVKDAPVKFQETAHYDGIGAAHSVVMNEETGYLYSTGNNSGGETCGGGLHMLDVRTPTKPAFVGCYAEPQTGSAKTGYTHDAQCLIYRGPDAQYKGREICLNSSETALGIADVTDKKSPKTISIANYPNAAYTHQGWFTEDQRYFFVNDEGDNGAGGSDKTRTIVFDLNDLDEPVVLMEFLGAANPPTGDHNLYIRGRYMYQSNYEAGLRIVDVADPKNPKEVGYLDTSNSGAGSWSNYPYFKNNVAAVTSMAEGLFLVRLLPQ